MFGAKCICCGRRTSEDYNAKPTCGACRKALELKLKAAQESHRTCPVDGAVMTKEVAYMMVIDRCPTCHGVWLDAEEMDHLTGDVAREAMMAIARGVFPVP
jgi:hypothetical protein